MIKKQSGKRDINKKLRLGLIIASIGIIIITSFLLINGLVNPGVEEESISLYDYSSNPHIDYEVLLKPNLLFDDRRLGEEETYFTEFLDNIDTNFNYEFTGEGEADITGNYEVIALVEGYTTEGEGTKTLWNKKFPVSKNQTFSKTDSGISIDENIKINLNKYNEFAREVSEASEISASSRVLLMMNVDLKAETSEGIIEEQASPTIVIPLEESSFMVQKSGIDQKDGSITETRKVETSLSTKLLIIYIISLVLSLLATIYLIVFTKDSVKDNRYEKELNKLFKKHGNRLVALDKDINSNYDNYYKVRSMEDLVRVADEIEKPIMYRYSSNCSEIKEFYVIEDDSLYTFDLENYIYSLEKNMNIKEKKSTIKTTI